MSELLSSQHTYRWMCIKKIGKQMLSVMILKFYFSGIVINSNLIAYVRESTWADDFACFCRFQLALQNLLMNSLAFCDISNFPFAFHFLVSREKHLKKFTADFAKKCLNKIQQKKLETVVELVEEIELGLNLRDKLHFLEGGLNQCESAFAKMKQFSENIYEI